MRATSLSRWLDVYQTMQGTTPGLRAGAKQCQMLPSRFACSSPPSPHRGLSRAVAPTAEPSPERSAFTREPRCLDYAAAGLVLRVRTVDC